MATGTIYVRNQFAPESIAFLKTQPDGYTSVTDNDAAIIASIEGGETLPSTPQNSALVEQVADIFSAQWGREPRPADGPHPAGDGSDSTSRPRPPPPMRDEPPITTSRGRRCVTVPDSSKMGKAGIRAALYWPAITAMTRCPAIKAFAERLAARGKAKKVIIFAMVYSNIKPPTILPKRLAVPRQQCTLVTRRLFSGRFTT